VLALVVAAAMAFAIFEPIQVLPRIRLAPGYALTDQTGALFSSETARGTVTLYTYAPLDCEADCDQIDATMAEVAERVAAEVDLGSTDFHLVTVALDSDPSASDLQAAASRSGADGETWRWIGGDESTVHNVVGAGFRRYYEPDDDGYQFDPGFVLVDGAGVIRGEYRYRTIADEADKLVHHIDILAEEVRHAGGATAVAYEAAHLFLCYP
jgi:protein SCO1/2